MSKKPNLAAALHEASGKKLAVAVAAPPAEATPSTPTEKPSSRMGKKIVAGHFDLAAVRQFKMLAMDKDCSMQVLLTEALNDLFVKYGRTPIA
jgi:hypothetical protein